MVTENEAKEVGVYLDSYRYGFMVMDASACAVSSEGEFACRYYGTDGRPSRQPMVASEFPTKDAALAFVEKSLLAKARENKAKADAQEDS